MAPYFGLGGGASDGLPGAGGFNPGGGAAGWLNSMCLAALALEDVNASAAVGGLSFQWESSNWWRSRCGSARYTARTNRGNLSSAPIQICTNTSLSAYATMSVVVPPTTLDCPM